MEQLLITLLDAVRTGGAEALAVLGWGMYFIERFYLHIKRDQQYLEREEYYRAEVEKVRNEYKELSDKITATLTHFTAVLEVLKDRVGR